MTENLNSNHNNKSSKEIRDERSREHKLEEQVLKTLPSNASIDEKFNLLLKKFVETEKNSKKLNITLKSHEKNYDLLLREKDNLQKEYNKGVLIRDKLEQVCREQQKLIKSVKNESFTKIREEEEKRRENQVKFQDSINEINLTLNKNNEENIKLKEDNLEMAKKLRYLVEQCQARENQLQKISEQIQLETQLHEAKLAKVQMEYTIEKETMLREKQITLDELLKCKKLIEEMRTREEVLKEQLNVYTSKYDDFQDSLQKSNDIFVIYKEEIEKMYKNSRKLEKELLEWKKKWEKSNATLIELATEKQEKDEYIIKLTKQMNQLQKLLRALQVERNTLYQILKDNNIPRPQMVLPSEPEVLLAMPTPPPPPSSSSLPKQSDKMDKMAQNCAELKQTLSKLQDQMNAITSKQTSSGSQSSSSSVSKENKKNKNKKSRNKVTEKLQTTASSTTTTTSTTASSSTDTAEKAKEQSATTTEDSSDVQNSNSSGEVLVVPNVTNTDEISNVDQCQVTKPSELITNEIVSEQNTKETTVNDTQQNNDTTIENTESSDKIEEVTNTVQNDSPNIVPINVDNNTKIPETLDNF